MSRQVDPDEARRFLRRVFGYLEGAVVSGLIYVGEQLGLYRALSDAGEPVTAEELAERTGLHPRWVLEWLRGQAAAELVAYRGEDRFELTDVGAYVLADAETSPVYAAGAFDGLPQRLGVLERLPEAFRTGIGFSFDALGPEGNHAVAQIHGPWVRQLFVPVVVPALEDVASKLERGATAADVGCGSGVALIEMAKAFPASEFHGYDISRHALRLAAQNTERAGIGNVTFHEAAGESLPDDGRFAFVTAFDCVHDMTRPQDVIARIRRALASDGTFLLVDVKAGATFEENIERNPMAALMYGFSLLSCLPSATSEPGGAALGTLGLHEGLARRLTEQAGFTRFGMHDFDHPVNVFYEVRP